jgi:hypothetical protein
MAIDVIALGKRVEDRKQPPYGGFKDIAEEPGGIAIAEFPRHGACRWPVSQGFFCGAPAPKDQSYCARHHRRAHNAVSRGTENVAETRV